MKRRILLVDDEVAVLLTMKAVLEISGFDVDTAASAREGKARLRTREYDMVITDMRMESDVAGHEVIQAARVAPYHPAVALLTAFPVDEGDWQELGSPKLLLKPMHTRVLLQQIEKLFDSHQQKLAKLTATSQAGSALTPAKSSTAKKSTKPTAKSLPSKAAAKVPKPAAKAAAPASKPAKKLPAKAAKKTAKKAVKTPAKKTATSSAKKSATK